MSVKISDLPALGSVSDSDILAVVQGGETKKIVHALNGVNGIINGGGKDGKDGFISQRGDYTTAAAILNNEYSLDRWRLYLSTVTATVQDLVDSIKYVATSTASGFLSPAQAVENYSKYAGETVTFSAKVKSNSADAKLIIFDGVSVGNNLIQDIVGDGVERTVSLTGDFNASATAMRCYITISADNLTTTPITSGDYIEFTDVRLDLGSHRLSGDRLDELSHCRRFWYQPATTQVYARHGTGVAASATVAVMLIYHPPLQSNADTLAYVAARLALYDESTFFPTISSIAISSNTSSETRTALTVTVGGGLTTGSVYTLVNYADATGYLGLGNEL